MKIWDFLQQYPTYGDNGNIYTDYLTNWGSIILLVHLITGRSPSSVDHGLKYGMIRRRHTLDELTDAWIPG